MADVVANYPPDPFASRAHVLHSALTRNHTAGLDIDPALFERFFQSPAFCAWSSGTRSWQLHCYGEPGCGKTTLAAVATARLPREMNGTRVAVASISISDHVASTSLDFVEDLLQCIHDSFGDEKSPFFIDYQHACRKGKSVVDRIQKLGTAISSAFPDICKYLILDGYDRINEALQSAVDFQLSLLQASGVKVMTTRRVPLFSPPLNAACDECELDELELWWECPKCKVFWLCYECREKGELENPHECEDASFEETYLHVSVKLGDFPVDDFAEERIKLYHFDLGLDMRKKIVEYIKSKAGGNITLTLLYLEDIFARNNFSALGADRVEDRLPRDIIAFFDAEMDFIERQPESQRLPPLLAISAAAHNEHGIPLAKLEECIRLAQQTSLDLDYPRGVEDVFKAANGWLTNPHTVNREVDLCCKPAFTLYVQEDYNDSLAWAKRKLGYGTEREMVTVASSQFFETPQLLGSTFDTLDSAMTHKTPYGSIGDALGLFGPGGMVNSPLLVGQEEEEGWVHSPPRMNSKEGVKSSALPIQLTRLSESRAFEKEPPPRRSKKRLCDFCTSRLLNSGASSGEHHKSVRGAEISMDHCIFCSSLYSIDMSLEKLPWPLYTWTIRALPRGRELQGSMMLRFWPAHPAVEPRSFRFLPRSNLHVPSATQLPVSTDPEKSRGYQIKEWIKACDRHHVGCSKHSNENRPSTSFLPTRLIDVDTGDENMVRLVETKIAKAKGPYCTLSHAWGRKEFITTTVWNMAKHLIEGIRMSELPPNFQQAIQTTRFLKVRYIWIDSLCIVQKPYGDFAEEGDLMHKVYRYSYCNIVAADSKDGFGGLFRSRDPHDVLPVEFRGTGANLGSKTWAIVPADMWERELLTSFIYTRGWVFQERMLSPRILHFTKHQIFWDCGALSACEVFPSGLPFPLDHKASTDRHWRGRLDQSHIPSHALSGANDNESSYTFWMSAVENYADCNLTSQGDKTVAIWSVAKLLRDISSEAYAVGMWSTSLEEQLAWRVRDVGKCERVPELQISIPSWSWASIKGPVLPQHRLADRCYKVKNHRGGEICFVTEPFTDANGKLIENLEKEPKLKEKVLAIAGFINTGRIVSANSGVCLEPLRGSWSSGHVEVFPDEPLANTSIDADSCAFVILAASISNTHESHSIPGDVPSSNRYSGIGILLEEYSLWYLHQQQKFHAFQQAVGNEELKGDDKWRMDAYEQLFLQRAKMTESLVYRRAGSVHFRDLDEQVYGQLQGGQLQRFWVK